MGRFALGGLLAVFCFSQTALAYTPTLAPNGRVVRWPGRARLPLAGNPINHTGISPEDFFASVVRSLERWKMASGGTVTFDYWQGTNPTIYEPNSNQNGLSSIYFASNTNGAPDISYNTLGLTQVWYDVGTAQIIETDTVLNDVNYHFTLDPHDTSGLGSASMGGNVYLDHVITHELGHAYGLSHSGVLNATMLFVESPEQEHLGCDELMGIRALYPAAGDSASRGAILGSVVADNGQPVFGSEVLAISRTRGTVLAAGISDRNGQFGISALEPGTYFLMAEPFFAGSGALPSYYSDMNANRVCGGEPFGRTMLASGALGSPVPVSVQAGALTQAGAIAVHCSSGSGAVVSEIPSSSTASSAPTIYNGATDGNGFGAADRFDRSGDLYYRLRAVSGTLSVHVLAYSLYSPAATELSLTDADGNFIPAETTGTVYVGESGFVNYDSVLSAPALASGDYFLHVSGSPLNPSHYPGGLRALDSVPFLLISGSVNAAVPALAGTVPENARCRMTENFTAYQSPPGDPERNSYTKSEDQSSTGFCATLASISNDGSGSGTSGPGAAAIAGWFLPWLMMAASVRLARRRFRLRPLRTA